MSVILARTGATFSNLSDAVAASRPGDEIQITRSLDIIEPVETSHPLRFVGTGARPVLTFRGLGPYGMGILTTRSDAQVRNLEFRGARTLTANGAGIWHEKGSLEVSDCTFVQNQNGLLAATGDTDGVRLDRCRFVANGAGCGHTHSVYVSSCGRLDVEQCSFENTRVGHHLKCRSARTRVINSYFGGEPDATTSYAIDVAKGGTAEIAHNLLVKGRASMSRKFIAYAAEGAKPGESSLDVRSNIFISHRRDLAVGVVNFALGTSARLTRNACEGRIVTLIGRGQNRQRQESSQAIMTGALSI